jgi:hypothetical protein
MKLRSGTFRLLLVVRSCCYELIPSYYNTNSAIPIPFVAFLLQINLSEFQSVSLNSTENLRSSVLCPLTQKGQWQRAVCFNSSVGSEQSVDLPLSEMQYRLQKWPYWKKPWLCIINVPITQSVENSEALKQSKIYNNSDCTSQKSASSLQQPIS